jgi:hypothetical protein
MHVVSRFLPALLIAAFSFTLAASAQTRNPITIQQCFVTVPKHMSTKASGTQITYVNNASQTATRVTFLVGYRNAEHNFRRQVTDVGSFAPGVVVDHHFALFNDVTFAGKNTTACNAVRVTFANGRVWHT